MDGDYKHSVELTDLPSESLIHLLSFLNYRQLSSCIQTCKRLRELARDDVLWKRQCGVYFLKQKCPIDLSWYRNFVELFRDYGPYIGCYTVIRTAWDKIEKYLQNFCPQLFSMLNGPADEADIFAAEMKMAKRYPDDLRCSLRIHNGQVLGQSPGLFGSIMISSHYRSEQILDAQTMAENFQNKGICKGCIPMTFCPNSNVMQFISISEEAGFKTGQVFYPCSTSTRWDTVDIYTGDFILANNFTEWLTNLAQEMEDDLYPRLNNEVFRWYNEPSSVAVTENVFTVKAATCFIPELSTINPPSFFTAYRITMSMDKDANPNQSCQLETRHWIITDEEGHEETVDGPGVVGEFPIMTPGATFSWISCTTFATTYGNMRGHFNMKNLQSGETLKIECPCYHMKCLPYQTVEDREKREKRCNEFRDSKENIIQNILGWNSD